MILLFGPLIIIMGLFGLGASGDPPPAFDLGIPVTSPNLISYKTAHGFGPAKLDLLCWTTTAESGGYFCAMNLGDGSVKIHPLNHLEAYPIVFGSDGRVYTGTTSGQVFSWDPKGDRWEPLGEPLFKYPGSTVNHVRVLCEGDGEWLYAGSCYGERARVSMRGGIVEKLPPTPENGNWYVSAIARLSDGRIAFGYGYKARVFIYDPKLGRDVAQVLPASWTKDGFCLNLVAGKEILYATHFPSGRRGAIDAATGSFLGEVPWPPDSSGHPWSKWVHSSGHGSALDFYPVPGTDAIVSFDGSQIRLFDPRATPASTMIAPSAFTPDPNLALAFRYQVTSDCRVLEYDPLRLRVKKELRPVLPPVERAVFALGTGPDGKIYGGAYQSTMLFRHDPAAGDTRVLGDHHPGWSGETFSYAVRRGELICASYTNGAVVGYNPGRPWECEQDAMVNPRFLGFFGQQVYRPYSTCVTEDGRIWSVGPAGWGSLGGGIGVCDPGSNTMETIPLGDVPHAIVVVKDHRLLVSSDSLLRWWDASANVQIASVSLPFRCVDVCRSELNSGIVLMIADSSRLLMVDARSPGSYKIMKSAKLPFACLRVLQSRNWAIVAGEKGLLAVSLISGQVHHFCSTPLRSRWAFALEDRSVYFGSGAHLMKAPLPEGVTGSN